MLVPGDHPPDVDALPSSSKRLPVRSARSTESWPQIDERDGHPAELRDICPLNEAGEPIEHLAVEACWTLGPFEERLARLQLAAGAESTRTGLRDLFATT